MQNEECRLKNEEGREGTVIMWGLDLRESFGSGK
jgi:hypothetical protein